MARAGADVFRNRSFALLIAVVASFFAIASVVSALVRDPEGVGTAGVWTPVAVVVAMALFCLLRLARAGVYADDAGIRVLNPFRTVRIPWNRVMRFSLRPEKGFAAVGFAELDDGSRVRIWGIQSRSATTAARRIPEKLIDALNERLRAERARVPAE